MTGTLQEFLGGITIITRNFTNTSDASQTVVPKCFEFGSYGKDKAIPWSGKKLLGHIYDHKAIIKVDNR